MLACAFFGVGVPDHVVRMVDRVKDFASWLNDSSESASEVTFAA